MRLKSQQSEFDILADIRESMLIIERFRARWNHQWAEPPIMDALKFALTEGGEEQRDQIAQALVLGLGSITTVTFFSGTSFAQYVDQTLRLKTAYSRNNVKAVAPNLNGELVDTIMMILSALLQVKHELGTDFRNMLKPIREALYSGEAQGFTSSFELMYRIARIGMMQEEEDEGWISEAVLLVCETMGMLDGEEPLPKLMKQRLDRIEYRLAATLDKATNPAIAA